MCNFSRTSTKHNVTLFLVLIWMVQCDACAWTTNTAICQCEDNSSTVTAVCSYAHLTYVPTNLSTNVVSLDLSHNRISILEGRTFVSSGATLLRNLNISFNGLQTVDQDSFIGLGQLSVLDLSRNSIRQLMPSVFVDNENLTELYLGGNPLLSLSDNFFSYVASLRVLDLSGCQLESIHKSHLQHLNHLRRLDLSRNLLRHMSVDTVQHLHFLNDIGLKGNPWRCDCHLLPFWAWFLGWSMRGEETPLNSIYCSEPPRSRHLSWANLVVNKDFVCGLRVEVLEHAMLPVETDNITLHCKVTSNVQAPDITWFFRDKPISNSTASNQAFTVSSIHGDPSWSNLTINRISRLSSGEYSCSASDGSSRVFKSITVDIETDIGESEKQHKTKVFPWLMSICILIGTLILVGGSITYCVLQIRRRRRKRFKKRQAKHDIKYRTRSNTPSPSKNRRVIDGVTYDVLNVSKTHTLQSKLSSTYSSHVFSPELTSNCDPQEKVKIHVSPGGKTFLCTNLGDVTSEDIPRNNTLPSFSESMEKLLRRSPTPQSPTFNYAVFPAFNTGTQSRYLCSAHKPKSRKISMP